MKLSDELRAAKVNLVYHSQFVGWAAKAEALEKALTDAAGQMECLQVNLNKGMSKSIQRMQGFALMETAASLRAAIDAAMKERVP